MPRRFTRKPRRSTMRRRRTGRVRKTFRRKRSHKSVSRSLGTLMPESLFVKLPWNQYYTITTSAAGQGSLSFPANIVSPDSLEPTTGNKFALGSTMPTGVKEYSNFYNDAVILGCSISLQIVNPINTGAGALTVIETCLVPLPLCGLDNVVNFNNGPTELDTLSFSQMSSFKGCQSRLVGSVTGGHDMIRYKGFRKTKNMLGATKMDDAPGAWFSLYNGAGSFAPTVNSSQWYWYLFVNLLGTTGVYSVDVYVKMVYYYKFSGRRHIQPQAA